MAANFAAYLKIVLEETFPDYITQATVETSSNPDGYAFGKPVWDFEYPESSVFITDNRLVGCCISVVGPEGIVFVPLGCTYPLVLRPDGGHFLAMDYTYTHGLMHGDWQLPATRFVDLR